MGWLSHRQSPKNDDTSYREAEKKVTDLERRADRVVPELLKRRDRNHWGETIAAIARKGHS